MSAIIGNAKGYAGKVGDGAGKVGRVVWQKCPKYERSTMYKAAICVGVGAGLGAVALPAIGFSSGGVGAGTLAAAWQSSIGNVAAGSAFAAIQSAGATGVGTMVCSCTGAVVGAISSRFISKL